MPAGLLSQSRFDAKGLGGTVSSRYSCTISGTSVFADIDLELLLIVLGRVRHVVNVDAVVPVVVDEALAEVVDVLVAIHLDHLVGVNPMDLVGVPGSTWHRPEEWRGPDHSGRCRQTGKSSFFPISMRARGRRDIVFARPFPGTGCSQRRTCSFGEVAHVHCEVHRHTGLHGPCSGA